MPSVLPGRVTPSLKYSAQKDILKAPPSPKSRTWVRVEKILPWVVYLAAITEAEWVTTYSNPHIGAVIHAIIFVALVTHSHLESKSPEGKLLLALSLAPLMRIIAIMIPTASFYQLYQHVIVSVPLLIATVIVMRMLKFGVEEVSFTLRRIPLQVAVTASGIPLGIIAYLILKPQSLIIGLTWSDIVLPGIIFILCTGFVQELIFRGVMQHTSLQVLGKWGILYISLLFAILSMGQFSGLSMLFMFGVAFFFSWIVKRTDSLLGVILAHGIMNVVLYLIAPSTL